MTNTIHKHNERAVAAMIDCMAGATTLADTRRLSELLAYSLGRVLLKNAIVSKTALAAPLADQRYIHITDWLVAALVNDEPWLRDLDDRGRPKKLMKFSDVAGILKEADKAMLKFVQRQRSVRLSENDEELALELDDGWYVARLLTPEALDRESGQMQHCIGQGSYDLRLSDPAYAYYSLRDPAGNAHATMEVDTNAMVPLQLQGKQNGEPLPQYIDRMLKFMKCRNIRPVQLSETSRWVFDTDYNRHDIRDLPDGVVLTGHVHVRHQNGICFPRNMTVAGTLDIRVSEISSMPENLTVGHLYRVKEASFGSIPRKLVMGEKGIVLMGLVADARVADTVENVGKLVFSHCNTVSIPKGLDAGSYLRLDTCNSYIGTENLTSLEKLEVDGCETMPMTSVDFRVNNLNVMETPCPVFSSQVRFAGDVTMRGCGLVRLPENLEVGGSLDISRNPVSVLPASTRVAGDLKISRTQIEFIPVETGRLRSLDASWTPLRTLEGLVVEQDIDVSSSAIKSIPDDFQVGGNLQASNSPIQWIGDGVTVNGTLSISRTDVERLPCNLVVGKGLDASYSSLRELPERFSTDGAISLAGSDVRTLPAGFHAKGDLNISTTQIVDFPDGVLIEGDLICKDGILETVSADTIVRGNVIHPAGNRVFPQERFNFETAKVNSVQRGAKA